MKHEIIERYKFIHSMDCFLYNAKCVCGEVLSAWTPQETEQKVEKHLKLLEAKQ